MKKIIIALAVVAVLAALAAFAPVNTERLHELEAQRIMQRVSEVMHADAAPHCSVIAMGEAAAPLAEAVQNAQPQPSSKSDACALALAVQGWQYSVEVRSGGNVLKTFNISQIRWTALLPSILAIAIAVATRRLLIALFIGVASGAMFAAIDGSPAGPMTGLTLGTADVLKHVLLDDFHLWIFVFTLSLIGMVNVTIASGGMAGLADMFAKAARTVRSTQLATALLGLAVFFDDYSNTVVVGGCMRPLSDKMRISREKLAFLVDSTAAPIAGLALVSTWIGYEVSLIGDSMRDLQMNGSAYSLFLSTLPYRFYCLFAIAFVFANIGLKREFGPMLAAETRARLEGEVLRKDSKPLSGAKQPDALGRPLASNAFLPVLSVIVLTLLGMGLNGAGVIAPWRVSASAWQAFEWSRLFVLENNYIVLCEDGAWVLAMASLFGSALALGLGALVAKAPLLKLIVAWAAALKVLMLAFGVLILAWAIGRVNGDLGTGAFLVSSLSDSIAPFLIPVIIFVLAGLVSFSTGSSWSTMAVLLPAAVPLAYYTGGLPLMVISVGAVLDGSILGDHCSPLSDTTIMSSISAGCDHLDHVRTQLPYSLSIGAVAIALGYLPAFFLPPYVSWIIGIAALLALLLIVGRRVGSPPSY